MVKVIIFDIDNTLIDFMELKRKSCSAAVRAMIDAGLDTDFDTGLKQLYKVYATKGMEYKFLFQEFLKNSHDKMDDRLVAHALVAYRHERDIKPFKGVIPVLKSLRYRGYRLAIVSDAPSLKAWVRLVMMGIDRYFDPVVTFEDTGVAKPDPKPFTTALVRLGVKPEECLMIGDNAKRDIAGAKAMGMKTCFAKYGSVTDVQDSGADFVIDGIEELLDVLEKIKDGSAAI